MRLELTPDELLSTTRAVRKRLDLERLSVLSALFPAWDALLAMLLVRILFSPWFRRPTLRLLAAGTLLLVGSDIAYFGALFNTPLAGRILSLTYTASYLLYGAAALHTSMRRVPPRTMLATNRRDADGRTIGVLALALTTTPVIFVVDQLFEGDIGGAVTAAISVLTVALVVLRLVRVLRRSDELRRRAEESERLFRTVFDAAGIGISVGSGGVMERTNPALQRMLGYSEAELARSHFTEISHPDDVADGPTVPVPGAAFTFEKRYLRKDGDAICAEVTLTAPADDSFGVAVIEDITARKQLERELRQSQKMEAVGQLAGGVAHDFNNLMTAVMGYAALLQLEIPETDARRARVDAIASAADRAAELTRKLLAFSRRQVLALETLDLAGIIEGFEPILRRLLPENIAVSYRLCEGAVARVDRGELEQVVLNLALNARDAMRDGGRLTIRVCAIGADVELIVQDTGAGMNDETRQRIFEPFFTTKPVGEGSGLGLSTVDGIVAQLGGTIEVASEPGAGTTFTIRLPLAEAEPCETVCMQAHDAKPAGDGTVLLVEDEEIVRHVTTEMLRLCGYEVVPAANAEDALTLLAGGLRPDVLISDVVMTGIDGPTLVANARKLLPALPVLFVSGYPAEALGDLSADVLLTKPFTTADLAQHIERVRGARVLAA